MTEPIRKILTQKILDGMDTLVVLGETDPVFGQVEMMYVQKPSVLPACGVRPIGLNKMESDLSADYLNYTYEISAYEFLESAATNTEVKNKFERLGDIEDAVLYWLSQLPNNLEYQVSGYHIYNVELGDVDYDIRETEQGILLFVFIEASFKLYNPFIKS